MNVSEAIAKRKSVRAYLDKPVSDDDLTKIVEAGRYPPHSAVNTALAAENMLLEATGLGLGSCYLVSPTMAFNGRENRDLAQEAGMPEDYALQCAIIVGYAAARNRFSVGRRGRKGSVNYVD